MNEDLQFANALNAAYISALLTIAGSVYPRGSKSVILMLIHVGLRPQVDF